MPTGSEGVGRALAGKEVAFWWPVSSLAPFMCLGAYLVCFLFHFILWEAFNVVQSSTEEPEPRGHREVCCPGHRWVMSVTVGQLVLSSDQQTLHDNVTTTPIQGEHLDHIHK